MNGTPGGTVTTGTRLFFDGGLWEVTELTATAVMLGGLRQASISGLLADRATRLLDAAPAEPAPAGAGTSALTPPETGEMRRLAGHVLEVLTGYQGGGEALALPGEPRPQYARDFATPCLSLELPRTARERCGSGDRQCPEGAVPRDQRRARA